MLTVLSRIINYGVKSFWRNGLLSTATIAIMVLALLVFGSLILFRVMTNEAVVSIKDKIDISVYFKSDAPEDEILDIKQSLESLVEVRSVDYVSSDEAFEIFQDRHKDDPDITQALNLLTENPLEASLNIKAQEPDQFASIAQFLNSPRLNEFVDKVNFTENQVVIERLNFLVNVLSRGGLLLTILLALVAGLVVYNTVRLAIYSNRDEIGIMRVVGASDLFVRGPYVVEGVISGALGAIVSLIILLPVAYFASPYVQGLVPSLSIFQYFYTHIWLLLFFQLLFGVVIGAASSLFAVRRYLKN